MNWRAAREACWTPRAAESHPDAGARFAVRVAPDQSLVSDGREPSHGVTGANCARLLNSHSAVTRAAAGAIDRTNRSTAAVVLRDRCGGHQQKPLCLRAGQYRMHVQLSKLVRPVDVGVRR